MRRSSWRSFRASLRRCRGSILTITTRGLLRLLWPILRVLSRVVGRIGLLRWLLPLLVMLVVGWWSGGIELRISLRWVPLRLLVALLRRIALMLLLIVWRLLPAFIGLLVS